MTPQTLLAAALALTATTVFAADGTFDKTLVPEGTPTVSVSTGSGYVHVFPSADGRVHITGHVHVHPGFFAEDAEARVKQIIANPPITQSGNIVTIGANHGDSDLYRNVAIDYDVLTPRATTLRAQTGSGELQIGGIDGAVSAQAGSGSIQAADLGPNARLGTGSGSIHATNIRGTANLQAGSGRIELSLTAPGDVKAETGSGSIHIEGLSGGLRAGTGSGTIEVAGYPTSEWHLNTGSGSIHLNPTANAHFNFSADTSSGTVRVDRPIVMQGSLNRHHVSGTVNGGGPTVRATTGSGEVTIH
jgi:Putative adhesin